MEKQMVTDSQRAMLTGLIGQLRAAAKKTEVEAHVTVSMSVCITAEFGEKELEAMTPEHMAEILMGLVSTHPSTPFFLDMVDSLALSGITEVTS